MTTEPKPCPFCQSENIHLLPCMYKDEEGGHMYCQNCCAYGPFKNKIDIAIEAWNAAPRN